VHIDRADLADFRVDAAVLPEGAKHGEADHLVVEQRDQSAGVGRLGQ